MTESKLQKIIASILATCVIAGGVVTGLKTIPPEKLTYDEARTLKAIYKYEIELQNGIELENVNQERIIPKLNEAILAREVTATTTIGELEIGAEDYKILRSGLIEKAELQTDFNFANWFK